MKTNPDNERTKHSYFAFLKEAKRLSESSIDAVAKSLDRFETYCGRRPFARFHREQAIAFKAALADQLSSRSKERLSKATIYSTLTHLKAFFQWLSMQRGFKSKLQYEDASYFNMSLKDMAVAKAVKEVRVPTMGEIYKALDAMPVSTPIERRSRALLAFAILTGSRDDSIASLRLKHVDMVERVVFHDARDVRVKFSKTFPTFFFPVGVHVETIVGEWVTYLRDVLERSPDSSLFPPTRGGFAADGQHGDRSFALECWANAAPIRDVFREAFERVGLPYFNPHSFRKTLVQLGMERCHTAEEFKAWSQNLGHEDVLTTFRSYGDISTQRQRDLIRNVGSANEHDKRIWELGRAAFSALQTRH